MKLIVGLGNPGREYTGTRHNIGFEVIDRLAERFGWAGSGEFDRVARSKFDGLACDGPVKLPGRSEKALLLKPMTFMNVSGRAVQAAAAFYQLATAQIMIVVALALGTPGFIIFGWLSDKIGRKPIILAGFLLAALTYFPIFKAITHFANPKLETALSASPVTVIADPGECSFQFKATGTEKFTTSCDVAKSGLVNLSVNYNNEAAPAGTKAKVKIGDQTLAADSPDFAKALPAAIKAHGYPASADPAEINHVMTVVMLWFLVIYVTLVYAPIAAWLVELFPSRIRYSGLSLPYHIGNGWFGGFLPATVFAIAAATGNIYSGLWYPIGVSVMSLIVGFLFLPETKDVDIRTN